MAPSTDPSVPSYLRVEPGSIDLPMGKFPTPSSSIAANKTIDLKAIAQITCNKLSSTLASKDTQAVVNLFLSDEGFWRDHLVNSWNFRTLKGRENIKKYLDEGCRIEKVELDDSGSAFRSPHVAAFDAGESKGLEFFITFESDHGRGEGVIRMAEEDEKWMIWNFFVSLKELKGYEEPLRHKRVAGVNHGADRTRKNWQDRRIEDENFTDKEPAVVIIGAGQGGLTAAARLKMLGVPTLIIDKNDRIGDNWRQRYAQLVLHDPVWYDHMPYVPFPPYWPIFTPKDKLAEWFESYAKLLELNVWMKTQLESCSYDDSSRQWTMIVNRTGSDGRPVVRTLHPRHIIQATGHSGKKNFPEIKGMDTFKGDRLVHSSEFSGARDNCAGKKAVVIGACNSSHDICQDYYEKGYDVTMIQRSSTCVVSSESITEIGLKGLYDENGPPTDDADMWLFALPGEIFKKLQQVVANLQAKNDAALHEGLKKAGFTLDQGPQDGGLFIKYFQRGGGYYIDVGASQLIIDGKVKVKSGHEITEITSNGLVFDDGTTLEADEIVFATGYQNMKTEARSIFGDSVFDRVNTVWGFDTEGELRTMWRKSGHPGFWFMGGNLALCRYYSKLLALQIKALEEGVCDYYDR